MQTAAPYEIYLELGKKRVFACAVDWPGWGRSGRDDGSAIEALIHYAPRYSEILESTDLAFTLPQGLDDFNIIERVEGNFYTDFGVPVIQINNDSVPLSAAEILRFIKILKACWQAFDKAVDSGEGRLLRKGPRGGGRELSEIIDHVADAERGFIRRIGGNAIVADEKDIHQRLVHVRNEIINGIQAASLWQLPAQGSRGVKQWPLAYFIRRIAWHVLDHTWEIDDRIT